MRIAVTEDNLETQSRICSLVAEAFPIATVEKFGNLAHSIAHATSMHVTCWLVDMGLPDGSGVDLIRKLHGLQPQCNVLVISAFAEPMGIIEALKAGANGYILKNGMENDLRQAMHAMFDGGAPLSPLIASRLLAHMLPQVSNLSNQPIGPLPEDLVLTARETELLNLLARGYSYGEAAGLMEVKLGTIQTYIKRIYAKLQVKSKTQAVFEAKSMGLIK